MDPAPDRGEDSKSKTRSPFRTGRRSAWLAESRTMPRNSSRRFQKCTWSDDRFETLGQYGPETDRRFCRLRRCSSIDNVWLNLVMDAPAMPTVPQSHSLNRVQQKSIAHHSIAQRPHLLVQVLEEYQSPSDRIFKSHMSSENTPSPSQPLVELAHDSIKRWLPACSIWCQ